MAWPYIGNQESVSKSNLRDVFKLFGKQFYPVCTSVVLENVFNFLIKSPSNLLKHFFTLCPLQCWLQSHNMALGWVKPRTYTQNSYLHRCNRGEGWMEPYPEFLICYSILKRFGLQWKAFDLLNKMRYISWVMALL